MNENSPLHIPKNSIIYLAEQQLEYLRLASTGDDILILANYLGTSRESLDKEIAAIDPKIRKNKQNGHVRLKKLERHVYTALLLFAGYCVLKKKSRLTLEDAQEWLQKIDAYVNGLRYDNKLFVVEQLFIPKIKVFLRALKSHILTHADAKPAVVMVSVFQFSAEMHAYIDTAKKIHALQIPATTGMVNDALLLFSNAEKQDDNSEWNYNIYITAEKVFGHIMVREEFSDENRAAIEHFKKSFTGNGPTHAIEDHVVELMDKDVTSSLLGVSALRYSQAHDEANRFLQLVCEYNLVARSSTEKEQEKEAQVLIPALRAFVSLVQHEPRLCVFSRAMLTHTLILAKTSPAHIMSSAIHLFCDVQQTEFTHMTRPDRWNDCVTEIMSRSVLYIIKNPQFSKEDKAFIQKTHPALLATELLKFDFAGFAQRIRRAIAVALLTSSTEMDKSVEKDALLIGQLKFISLCIPDETVSKRLKEFSALLNAYRYFTGSMNLSFLDGPTDERFTEAMHTAQTSDVSRPYLLDMTRHFSALKDFNVMATFFLFCKKALMQPDPELKKECANILWAYAHNTIVFLCEIEIHRIKDAIATKKIATLIAEYKTRRTKCSKLDSQIYSTLLLYIDYLTLGSVDSQEVIRQFHADEKDLSPMDKVLSHRMRVFVIALSAHTRILTQSTFSSVKSATLYVLCELSKLRAYTTDNLSTLPFYTKAMGVFKCWEDGTLQSLEAALKHVHEDSEASATDKAFFEYYDNGTTITPESFASTSTLLALDYLTFARTLEIEIARLILSQKTEPKMDIYIEENMFLLGQLLFLKLQLMRVGRTGKVYDEIQKRLNTVLPLLYLYRSLLQSPLCYINVEVDEKNEFTFFNQLSIGLKPATTDNLIHLCFLIEETENKDILLKKLILKKRKVSTLTDETLQTLSALFTKPQTCASAVRNYFIAVEKFKWQFENVSSKAGFFLICRKVLGLKNAELTALTEKNLRGFQGNAPTQTAEPALSIDEQLALIASPQAPAKKKKPPNNKKKKKKQKNSMMQPKPPQHETPPVEIPAEKPAPETAPTQREETTLSLMKYLARAKWLPGNAVELRCPPVERMMDLFNPLATEDNKYQFATFLMGGAIRDLLLKRSPKDWDINIFATTDEIRVMLETHKTELQIDTISFVKEGYAHFIVTFTDAPNVVLDISPLDSTHEKSLHRIISDTQKSLDYEVNSLFYTRLNGCSFIRDPHSALTALEKFTLNHIECERSTTRITTVMIRGAILLKKCPELKPSDTLLAWYAENKTLLATTPAAKRTFVKLLYSDMACEALTAMHQLGFLEQLCPPLVSVLEKTYFTEWVKAFVHEESAILKARAETSQEEFEKVHEEVLQKYLTKATTKIKLTAFTFKPQGNGPHSSLTFKPETDAEKFAHAILPPMTNMGSSKNGNGN